jgi:hypothetical protein
MPTPLSASAALKMQTPRKNFPNNRLLSNRDASPAPDSRPRANSVKRKEPEGPSFAEIVNGGACAKPAFEFNIDISEFSIVTLEVAKASSLVEKAATEVNDQIKDPATVAVFGSILDAMRGITTVQDKLATNALTIAGHLNTISASKLSAPVGSGIGAGCAQPVSTSSGMVNLGAIPKKPRSDTPPSNLAIPVPELLVASRPSERNFTPAGAVPEDPVKKNFRETIREAEKSTLIFNLDMGKVPLMNKETMAKKATLALTAMAAAKEKKNTSIPSEEAITALDDILSVTENYKFIGSGTKSYKNAKDPLNGSFCTAPVRYDFKDKDTRFNAEKVLRSRCGVNCAVPYPALVRDCTKQIVDEVKKVFPDNFVRVTVDTNRFVFKVARRPPKSDPEPYWHYGFKDIPIPDCVLELKLRKLPDNFKIEVPVPVPNTNEQVVQNRRSSSSGSPMLVDGQGGPTQNDNE